MHARVVTAELKPGKLDEFVEVFRSEIVPHARGDQGFVSVRLMTDRSSNRALAVAVYQSEADVTESEPRFQERAGKIRDFVTEPPSSAFYEVSADS